MDHILDLAYAAILALLGWYAKSIDRSVSSLQTSDKELADKVARIELLVAGRYATRDELNQVYTQLLAKLDLIDNKLDGKADKRTQGAK